MGILQDRFGRRIDYLRISLTDRCNMRCFYCMPDGSPDFVKSQDMLDADELALVVRAMSARGLRKVRLTGGEPLLRPDVVEIVERIAETEGIQDVAMSTNALLLPEKALALSRAGLCRVNISLDTLDPLRFARLTGSTLHRRVLKGIYAALEADMSPVKINVVSLPDLDVFDLEALVVWASRHRLHLRFIEQMPFGAAVPPDSGNARIRLLIESFAGPLEEVPHDPLTNLLPPCRVHGESWQITFISPMTAPFCAACNRVRLTARGFLKLCLDEDIGIDLAPLVRAGGDVDAIGQAIVHSVYYHKPEQHHFNDPGFDRAGRIMARIGG